MAVAQSICDGVTDARAALQATLTANAGKVIVLPDGATCLITPVANKSAFLTLPAGTILKGNATLKVASGSAPYYKVLDGGAGCNGCQLSDFTIDANVAGNPLTSSGDVLTSGHQRTEIWLTGADISVNRVTVKNTSSLNSLIFGGGSTRYSITNCTFSNIGDDPNHFAHDLSTLYLHGSQVRVTGNHFTGAFRGAPAAVTAIETHATSYTVSGNDIKDYQNAINGGGQGLDDSEASVINGNSIAGALFGIHLWSHIYNAHSTGFGINGLTVSGNSIRINQNSYKSSYTGGIIFNAGNSLPVRNVIISGNTVVFDPETSVRTGSTSSIGIGAYGLSTATYSNIVVANNLIDNAPVAGIRFSVPSINGLVVKNNVIRNAGGSLDSAVNAGYKVPVVVVASAGAINGEISSNTIIDDFAASRITYPFILGSTAAGSLTMLWNTISLADAAAASWQSYMGGIQDNNTRPLFRHIATGKPWTAPARAMRNGSQVYDTTTGAQYNLLTDGTGWSTVAGSTNPGCSTPRDVGKQWFDITSSANTVYRVCVMVSGAAAWVVK